MKDIDERRLGHHEQLNTKDENCHCGFRIIGGQIDLQRFHGTYMVGSWT